MGGGHDTDVSRLVQAAAERDPALRERLADAGLEAASVTEAGALSAVRVQSKDEMVAARVHVLSGETPRRVFQSPGPIYEAQPAGEDPWRWREALEAAGLTPGDIVLNCFGYHLSPAGAMFDEGVIAAGGTVLPAGIGNQQLQVQAIRDLGIRGYVGLPSYLKALLDLHAADGGTAESLPLQWAVVTAEPLPDSLRQELESWGLRVRMAYGTAEAGLIAFEDATGPGLVTAAGITVEVCDIADGTPLDEGPGEVVVTILRESAPLIRFGTGDLSAWVPDGGPGGSGGQRLAGVLGRTGQAVKVRGMFLHPAQVRAAASQIPGIDGLRFVIDREDHKDTVVAEVVVAAGADEAAVVARAAEGIRSALRFRAEVRPVAQVDPAEPIDDRRSWD